MAEVLGVSGIDSLQRFSLATRQPFVDGGLECPFSQVGLARLSLEPPVFVANLGMGLKEGLVTQSSAMLDRQPWFFEPRDGSSVTAVEGPESRNLLLWFGEAPAGLLEVLEFTQLFGSYTAGLVGPFATKPPADSLLAARTDLECGELVERIEATAASGKPSTAWVFEPTTPRASG